MTEENILLYHKVTHTLLCIKYSSAEKYLAYVKFPK